MESTSGPTGERVAPRPAATLVILRDGEPGLEVLLTVRAREMSFMGGASVFPGGVITPGDRDPRWEDASTLGVADAATRLANGSDPLAPFVCALREAFEEVGYLTGEGVLENLSRADAEPAERFLARCLSLGVKLGTDRLVPAGRWVTPLGSPLRFDAWFFATQGPDGWEPEPDPKEVAGCTWTTPLQALAELGEGRRLMAPPTIEMLQRLTRFEHAADAVAAIRQHPAGATEIIAARLSPLVQLVLAPNPGVMTGPGTNTYVVGSGETCVIDPAVDDVRYLDAVAASAGEVRSILVTHRHEDHVGGVAAMVARTGSSVRAFGSAPAGGIHVEPLQDGEVIQVGGARIRVLHTPGHASDHLCFLLEGAASLFAGDNILGEGTAVIAPPDGDMADYLSSLRRLRELHVDRIYPGHWRPLDGGRAVIDGYLAHRKARENEILAALAGGAATLDDVVARAYADTPLELHPVARFSALAHLEMLQDEGRVERKDELWELKSVH